MFQTQNSRFLPLAFSFLFFISCMISIPVNTSSKSDASLADTTWKLIELKGKPVSPGAGEKELHMVLTSDGTKVRGFSGCNRFMGGYKTDDNQIQLGPLAGTMMACMEGMDQEHTFLRSLESSKRFSISGEELTLYNADDQLILRFKAVYLQ